MMTRLVTGILFKINDFTKTPGKGLKVKTQEKRLNYYKYVKNSVKIRTILLTKTEYDKEIIKSQTLSIPINEFGGQNLAKTMI